MKSWKRIKKEIINSFLNTKNNYYYLLFLIWKGVTTPLYPLLKMPYYIGGFQPPFLIPQAIEELLTSANTQSFFNN